MVAVILVIVVVESCIFIYCEH